MYDEEIVVKKKVNHSKFKVVVLDKNFNAEFQFGKVEKVGELHVSESVRTSTLFTGEALSTRAGTKSWYVLAITAGNLIYAISKGSATKEAAELVAKQTINASGDNPFYNAAKALWRDNTKNELALKKGKLVP